MVKLKSIKKNSQSVQIKTLTSMGSSVSFGLPTMDLLTASMKPAYEQNNARGTQSL